MDIFADMTFNKEDRIMVLGSCFAAGLGKRLAEMGYETCINPFGTLFNPVSIRQSIDRLHSPEPFTEQDCVRMGAGSDLWCSFSHYTKFARQTKEEFLKNANAALAEASEFYKTANKLIITFGTAYCFRHIERNRIVANCLKRPAAEFERFRLSTEEIVSLYKDCDTGRAKQETQPGKALDGKDIIFTVSPIRHLADGAHGNQLSKATLLLATEAIIAAHEASNPGGNKWSYFPSYEIMLDELRDYRWFAADRVHPSELAEEIIFDRFERDFK